MFELAGYSGLLTAANWLYWIVAGLVLWWAWRAPATRRTKMVAVALVGVLFLVLPAIRIYHFASYKWKYNQAKALFDERCKTAGEKIFKVVEGEEGIALLNLRIGTSTEREGDARWQGAGLPQDATNDGYIGNFLEWEHDSGSNSGRGYLNSNPENAKAMGYRFVDVKQPDGGFLRYRINTAKRTSVKDYLVSELVKGSPARYAVSYEDLAPSEDRNHWVAGARVTILDTQTGELMAELRAFAFEPGLGSRDGFRQPWRFAQTCPQPKRGDTHYATRFFVDQVVKPVQGK